MIVNSLPEIFDSFQQVYRISYYILGFLNDSEVNDSYFDVGDLFPHVTYFFPFEYT